MTFEALSQEQIGRIAELVVERVGQRLQAERGIALEVDPELVARLARDGFDEAFGARPLQRHVRRTLEKEVTRAILDGRLTEGVTVAARLAGEDGTIALDVAGPATAPALAHAA